MVVIHQLAEFTGIRSAETFFESLHLHLEPADLLEQLDLLGLPLVIWSLDSSSSLPLPLALLDRMDGVVCGNLLDRCAATDRLHGDHGLEIWIVGVPL